MKRIFGKYPTLFTRKLPKFKVHSGQILKKLWLIWKKIESNFKEIPADPEVVLVKFCSNMEEILVKLKKNPAQEVRQKSDISDRRSKG